MAKSLDGVCEECGNTGIVGDPCLVCGGRIESLDKDLERFEEDERVPSPKKTNVLDDFDVEPDDEELENIDQDLDGLDDDFGGSELSIDEMAEEEFEEEGDEPVMDDVEET